MIKPPLLPLKEMKTPPTQELKTLRALEKTGRGGVKLQSLHNKAQSGMSLDCLRNDNKILRDSNTLSTNPQMKARASELQSHRRFQSPMMPIQNQNNLPQVVSQLNLNHKFPSAAKGRFVPFKQIDQNIQQSNQLSVIAKLTDLKAKKPAFIVGEASNSISHSVSDSVEMVKEKQTNNHVLDLIQNQSKIIGQRKRFINPLQLEKKQKTPDQFSSNKPIMMSEEENPFVSPASPEIDNIVNIGISDADLRLQKEYSAPFFGGIENEKGEKDEPLADILSEKFSDLGIDQQENRRIDMSQSPDIPVDLDSRGRVNTMYLKGNYPTGTTVDEAENDGKISPISQNLPNEENEIVVDADYECNELYLATNSNPVDGEEDEDEVYADEYFNEVPDPQFQGSIVDVSPAAAERQTEI